MPGSSTNGDSSPASGDRTVRAALAGDLDAFEKLVLEHHRGIRAYLAARLSGKDDSEDLAQEVFIVAYRKRATFSGNSPVGAWFRGIARNLLKNHTRKFRARPIGGSEELQSLLDQDTQSVEEGGDLLGVLRECVDELDGPARDLIAARYFDGETVRQIEAKTGRGYSALTMQLHRIRSVLADCVEQKLGYAPR